jgi:UDP-glucose:(heptosyl)LPS alpha-1,3-glucosyltransferase
MRIALVIDRFLPHKGGGERYVQILAQNLASKGHEVTIFARCFSPPSSQQERVRFHHIPTPGWPGFFRVLAFARRCKREITPGEFDIVHDVGHIVGADIFNPHGGVEQVWLKRYFASYANPVHRTLKKVQRLLSPKEWVVLYLQRRQYLSRKTHRILAIAPMIKTHIQERYPEIPEEKVVMIQNPAELKRFNPQNRSAFRRDQRNLLDLKEKEIALLFAGNNFRLKGLYPLLNSLTVLKEMATAAQPFRLFIAGNESTDRWQKLARKIGVEDLVVFLGPVREMEKLYAATDIFVLPTFYDSASLVVLEALASGLPVVTSRWNGTNTLIDVPATGMVLENNDNPEEIARTLYRFFPEEARKEALRAAPERVKSINLASHIDRILNLYEMVIRENTHE